MENPKEKMRIFLNASIQKITMLAEILASEVIREKPKDPYKHLAMCLQTMIDIRDTTDFHEHIRTVATQTAYENYEPDYKRSLEILYEKAAISAIQETDRNQSDCKPHTASELMQIKAATIIQRAYRRHCNFSCLENEGAILSQRQQTDRIIEEAYKQHRSLYEQDEISEEHAAVLIQEAFRPIQSIINSMDSHTSLVNKDIDLGETPLLNEEQIKREVSDGLNEKSKKYLMDSIDDESAISTASTRSSVDPEENILWYENLMSGQRSVPSRQRSTIASDLKKRPSWISSNVTSDILPSYTKHSPNDEKTTRKSNKSCELPKSPEQCLVTKCEISSSNRTLKSPYSSYNLDDMLHITRSKTPSPKNSSADKRNSISAIRHQKKNSSPINLSTDLRDLSSCMTIKSLSKTPERKKCHSVPVNSTQRSLTPPPDRPHSFSLPCIAESTQQSIDPAAPPSSPRKKSH